MTLQLLEFKYGLVNTIYCNWLVVYMMVICIYFECMRVLNAG